MKKEVLGVKIDDLSITEIVRIVEGWLKKGGKHYITTPNPEIVMMAQKDLELKKIINNCDLAIPDGNGLKIGTDIVCNSPGIDVLEALVKLAADYGFTTGFLGGAEGVAEKAAERLQKKYKNLKVTFANSGGEVDNQGNSQQATGNSTKNTDAYRLLPNASLDLLFVAFGPPKQEKWIYKNLGKLNVKVMMGVGGSLDYLSGEVKRAPKIVRAIGFEWLFRLIVQPWRIKRQLSLIKYLTFLRSSRT